MPGEGEGEGEGREQGWNVGVRPKERKRVSSEGWWRVGGVALTRSSWDDSQLTESSHEGYGGMWHLQKLVST